LNCCGVKLRLQYPEFCELIKKNDLVCLQETKTDDIDKIDLEGYSISDPFNEKCISTRGKKNLPVGYKLYQRCGHHSS
jgi:exonuclease III